MAAVPGLSRLATPTSPPPQRSAQHRRPSAQRRRPIPAL